MAAYDYGLRSVIGAIAGMDIIQVHDNITMILHNIHTDLVSTRNASTTRTPPEAKVSVNVVKHHCYINMNFSSVHDILSERVGCGGTF